MGKEGKFESEIGLRPELRERVEIGESSLPNERYPETNEDAVLVDRERLLFGVFDGLGGHKAGEVASRTAKDFVEKLAYEITLDVNPAEAAHALAEVLQDANERIAAMANAKPEYWGMATTAVVAKLVRVGDAWKTVVVSVGDSRAYRLPRGGKLEQITLDDSPVREQFHNEVQAREVQKKLSNATSIRNLTSQEATLFASRNRVTQSLGRGEMTPRIYIVDLEAGDVLFLSSDGVHDNLTDDEMEALCRDSSGDITRKLTENSRRRSRELKEANPRAHVDDMTAVALKVAA